MNGRGGLRSGSRGSTVGLLAASEVVLHLCVELLSSLGLGLTSTTGLLLLVAASLSGALCTVGGLRALCGGSLVLLLGSVLGLTVECVSTFTRLCCTRAFNLRDTVAEALGRGGSGEALSTHNNLDLCSFSERSCSNDKV